MVLNPGQTCSAVCPDFTPGEIIQFDPEPDLAGIGVIVSFMVTLIFTILITWAATIVVETFCYHGGDEIAKFNVSSISERSRIVREKIDTTAKGRKLRHACFITLIFSDQQLIVGTSLLTSAYIKHCTLTQYHFEIASLLSLCSFRTFQFAAGILAGTLKSSFSKGWRLFWVTVVANMILVTNIFRMNSYYLRPFGSPLYCLREALNSGVGYDGTQAARLAYTILTEVILVYIRCLMRLFPSLYDWSPMRNSISGLQRILLLPGKKHLEALERGDTWRARFFWVLTFISIMTRYLMSSTAMEIGAVTAIFVRVMFLVWTARSLASERGRNGSENGWGFGQLLPLFLLALPVTTLVESIRSPWEISSSANPPKGLETETPKEAKLETMSCFLTNILWKSEKVTISSGPIEPSSSTTALHQPDDPQPAARRVRSFSSPELVVDKQIFKPRLPGSSGSSKRMLSPLEVSPTLECQRNGAGYNSDREWQNKVERYESTYLNKGMFQLWIFLFNIGILVLHTIVILPAPYG